MDLGFWIESKIPNPKSYSASRDHPGLSRRVWNAVAAW